MPSALREDIGRCDERFLFGMEQLSRVAIGCGTYVSSGCSR